MWLVQRRFQILQQPPSLLLLLAHSPPLTGSVLRRSLSTCPVAIYNCSFLHERRGRENKTGFTHERGQWSFFLASMIKHKPLFQGIILLNQLNIKISASSEKRWSYHLCSPWASSSMRLWLRWKDFIHRFSWWKTDREKLNHEEFGMTLLTFADALIITCCSCYVRNSYVWVEEHPPETPVAARFNWKSSSRTRSEIIWSHFGVESKQLKHNTGLQWSHCENHYFLLI